MNIEIILEIETYIQNLFASEDPILLNVKKSMLNSCIPPHNIFPNQAKLLTLLLKAGRCKNVLEIGTLAGYSTIWLARAIPEDGQIITIELNNEFADIAENNFVEANVNTKVQLLRGEALNVLEQLDNNGTDSFDFIFMDAHKPSYIAYFDWAIRHAHPGTIIVADNVIRDGEILTHSPDEKAIAMDAYNKMLSKRVDIDTIIIPNVSGNGYDGMAVSIVN